MASRLCTIGNIETGRDFVAQFNPRKVEIELAAFYARLKIPGSGHEELQYSNTGNTRVKFQLENDFLVKGAPNFDAVEKQLLSLLQPPQSIAGGVTTGAPPRVLFSWKGWISLVTVMPSIKIVATRFSEDGPPTAWTIDVELEEKRSTRLGSELVMQRGLRREA